MSALELIGRLRKAGVQLAVRDGNIKLRAEKGALTDELKQEIVAHKQEIIALKDKVDPLVWQAIDGVRAIGNIGAHMEKNINHIIDVEPDEADKLIGLVEYLVDEWYVGRHNRQEQLEAIVSLAGEKKNERQSGGSSNESSPPSN